jgi:hypothetical protein
MTTVEDITRKLRDLPADVLDAVRLDDLLTP